MKALLYCTKAKPYLNCDFGTDSPEDYKGNWHIYTADKEKECSKVVNGFIVAECEIDKVEEIVATKWDVGCGCAYYQFKTKDLLRKSCLKYIDLNDYLDRENGYALHLKNLKVFDEPKELSEYCIYTYPTFDKDNILKGAPQNMCRVLTKNGYPYILISIKPEWLCKILNGEKTIEVRKKVLNCLKELD